jgi:hypothetical protein
MARDFPEDLDDLFDPRLIMINHISSGVVYKWCAYKGKHWSHAPHAINEAEKRRLASLHANILYLEYILKVFLSFKGNDVYNCGKRNSAWK